MQHEITAVQQKYLARTGSVAFVFSHCRGVEARNLEDIERTQATTSQPFGECFANEQKKGRGGGGSCGVHGRGQPLGWGKMELYSSSISSKTEVGRALQESVDKGWAVHGTTRTPRAPHPRGNPLRDQIKLLCGMWHTYGMENCAGKKAVWLTIC